MGYDTIQAEMLGDRAPSERFAFCTCAQEMLSRVVLVKKTLPQGKHDEYTMSSDCQAA